MPNIPANRIGLLKSTQILSSTNASELRSIAAMKTKLLTQGYTQVMLDRMNENDLTYAYRMKNNLAP